MKYKKIWKYQPYRTSRREQDYQQVQEFLKSGDPELWKALYESAYEIVYQCAYGMDFCRVLGPDDYCEIADEAFALCYEQLDRISGAQPVLRLGRRVQQKHYPHPLSAGVDRPTVSPAAL